MTRDTSSPRFTSFAAFYRFYLKEHSRASTRAFHVAGTLIFILALALGSLVLAPLWVVFGVIAAYALAWFSHFCLERNRPASFKQPVYSLLADFRMAFEILTLRRPLRESAPDL